MLKNRVFEFFQLGTEGRFQGLLVLGRHLRRAALATGFRRVSLTTGFLGGGHPVVLLLRAASSTSNPAERQHSWTGAGFGTFARECARECSKSVLYGELPQIAPAVL